MMKTLRNIVISVIVTMFISFFLYNFYLVNQGRKEFISRHYNGIILEIRKIEGRRDLPDIRINNEWLMINMLESKITHYIQVGDSIVKEPGSEKIKVYRKDENNKWYVKEFK